MVGKPTATEIERYTERVNDIYMETYQSKMVSLLEKIMGAFERYEHVKVEGPFDLSDDCYRWFIRVQFDVGTDRFVPNENFDNLVPEPVDITVEIAESVQYDGTLDGVNFGLNIVEEGGLILGGLTPYNYTDKVWVDVDNANALESRWNLLANNANAGEIAHIVLDRAPFEVTWKDA